jgi:large subunit ribosomal protein L6
MSKIAKIPVVIRDGVTVSLDKSNISVTGSKGSLSFVIPSGIEVKQEDGKLVFSQTLKNDEKTKALFGLTRSLVSNMVEGVSTGFDKKLELSGVGYRAQAAGDTLTLSLGFSHPVVIKGKQGITFAVSENVISVSGIDKALVGDTAARIRAIRPPEPYKGKGIKYQGERIRRKVGKAAKAVGAK